MGVSHTPHPVTDLDDRGPGPGTRAFLAPVCFPLFNTFSSLPAPIIRHSCFRGRRPQQKSFSHRPYRPYPRTINSSPAPLQRRPRPSNHQTTVISIALWEYPISIDPPSQLDQPLFVAQCSHLSVGSRDPTSSLEYIFLSSERISLSPSSVKTRSNQVSLNPGWFPTLSNGTSTCLAHPTLGAP